MRVFVYVICRCLSDTARIVRWERKNTVAEMPSTMANKILGTMSRYLSFILWISILLPFCLDTVVSVPDEKERGYDFLLPEIYNSIDPTAKRIKRELMPHREAVWEMAVTCAGLGFVGINKPFANRGRGESYPPIRRWTISLS